MGGKGCHGEHTSFREVKLKEMCTKSSQLTVYSGNQGFFFSHDILVWWKGIGRVGHNSNFKAFRFLR